MDTIFNSIQVIMDTLDESDINYVISRKLLEYIHKDIDDLSITVLAEECFTSPSTITRYTKNLGFKNFIDLKNSLIRNKEFLKEMRKDNYNNLIFNKTTDKQSLISYIETIKNSMDDFAESVDFNGIDRLIDTIHSCSDVYLFGMQLSGSFAYYLQYMLMSYGKVAHFAFSTVQEKKFVNQMQKNDLCIFLTTDGNYFNARKYILEKVKKQQVKTFVVTQNPNNRTLSDIDHVIYIGNYQKGRASNYKLLVWIEVLLSRYFNKYI